MLRRYLSGALLFVGALLPVSCADAQVAVVDFDSALIIVQDFLGTGFTLRGVDSDGNGINEDDQLGMLSAILRGGADTECIDGAVVTEIQAGFQQNRTAVVSELTVTVGSQGTVNLISQLNSTNAALGQAMQNLLAGIITIADEETLAYINGLADQVIVKVLSGTPEEDAIGSVQGQINFTAAEYATFGSAASEPDYIGAAGDLDGDELSNLEEYEEPEDKTREQWLIDNCLTPPLRIKTLSTAGNRVTGVVLPFVAEAAGGTGNYTYAWHKGVPGNSTLLAVASTYTIDFLRTSDSGNYFCIIDDGESTIFSPIRPLTVTFVPLFISQQLQNTTRAVGDTFTFTLGVQGGAPGPYAFTWRKNGVVIEGANTRTLTLSNLQTSDSGQYEVSVTSNGGPDTRTSGPVTLTVQTSLPPLTISQQPQTATVVVGNNFNLSVGVSGGSGSYSYQWRKNGFNIQGATNQTLNFNPIKLADAGIFDCVVTDASLIVTPITSGTAEITVVTQPLEITQQPQPLTVALGEPATFSIQVIGGSGTYIFSWRKNGEPVFGAPNTPQYTIAATASIDAGDYQCIVSDAVEPIPPVNSNVVALTVIEPDPLEIVTQPVAVDAYEGDAVTFTVAAVGGSESYRYDWYRNGTLIPNLNSPSLTINPATDQSAGNYRCEVVDLLLTGTSAVSETVALAVFPHLVLEGQPVGFNLRTGDPLLLEAPTSGGRPPVVYQWFLDDEPIPGADGPTLDLGGADLAEAGVYHMTVADSLTDAFETDPATVNVALIETPVTPATFEVNLFAAQVVPASGSPNLGNGTGSLRRVGAASADGAIFSIIITHSVGSIVQGETVEALELREGAQGFNGEVIIDLGNDLFQISAEVELTEEEASKVLAGNTHLLFRSSTRPNGDIRGQILPQITEVILHAADTNNDGSLSLSELLRIIQLYNTGALRCQADSEDGFAPGTGDTACAPHSSDYNPQNWTISLSELLRAIQLYNSGEFHPCTGGEDGFCPGPAPQG